MQVSQVVAEPEQVAQGEVQAKHWALLRYCPVGQERHSFRSLVEQVAQPEKQAVQFIVLVKRT